MFKTITSVFRYNSNNLFQKAAFNNSLYTQSIAWMSQAQSNQESKVVLIKGLPQAWRESDILGHFSGNESTIGKVNLIKNKAGEATGKAVLTFGELDQAKNFIAKWNNNKLKSNEVITADYFAVQKRETASPQSQVDLRQVYVYNLSWKCGSEDLNKLASDFGVVANIELPTTSTNKNKGFAYITFQDAKDAQRFIQAINEKDFLGRKLKVTLSTTRFESKNKKIESYTNFYLNQEPKRERKFEDKDHDDNLKLYKSLLTSTEQPSLQGKRLIRAYLRNPLRDRDLEF
jgi:hypothetical protein